MSSLEEVWERIEALKRDLEELGVKVRVRTWGPSRDKSKRVHATLIIAMLKDLEEGP